MFTRILVAYDGPEHSCRALAEATDLAPTDGAELTVLTVVPRVANWIEVATVPPRNVFVLQQEIEDAWRAEEERAVHELPDDIRVTSKLRVGYAAEEIVAQAKAGAADLIIVGSRGRGEPQSLFLGSVSQDVAHTGPVPVLIVAAG